MDTAIKPTERPIKFVEFIAAYISSIIFLFEYVKSSRERFFNDNL